MIYVIIPNLTLSEELENLALDAIESFKKTAECIVVISDDNSPRDSSAIEKAADVFLKRKTQGGFSKCCNTGFRYALDKDDCDYIVCANNDIVVNEGWKEEFMKVFDFGADLVGGLGCKEKDVKNPRANDNYLSEGGRMDDWLFPGGFWCMKKTVMDEIGLLDEGFEHGGMEDVDYFYRAKQAGKRLIMTPKVWYWHKEGATRYSDGEKETQKEAFLKNINYFEKKHGFDGYRELNRILVDNRINF